MQILEKEKKMNNQIQLVLDKLQKQIIDYAYLISKGIQSNKTVEDYKQDAIDEISEYLGIPNKRKAKKIAKEIVKDFIDALMQQIQKEQIN